MRQINVPVEDAAYEAAKVAAARKGMLFRKWVERAILDACEPQDFRRPGETDRYVQPRNIERRVYEPIDE
jgi:hypothetical protein